MGMFSKFKAAYKKGSNGVRNFRRENDVDKAREDAILEDAERNRKHSRPSQQSDNSGDDGRGDATGSGGSPVNPTNINIMPPRRSWWTFWILITLIIGLLLYFFGDKIISTINISLTLKVLGVAGFLLFIGMGFFKPNSENGDRLTRFTIALALLVWAMDMLPTEMPFWKLGTLDLGSPFTGFELIPIHVLTLELSHILFSGAVLIISYFCMVYWITKKRIWLVFFYFIFIVISNKVISRLPTLSLDVYLPWLNWVWTGIWIAIIGGIIFLFYLAHRLDKKLSQEAIDFTTQFVLILVISFFFLNAGWVSLRSMLHFLFILYFGFSYVGKHEKNKAFVNILIAALLILDFFGTGFLKNTIVFQNYLWLISIPPLLIFVIFYCYGKTEDRYAIGAFVLLVTIILIMFLDTTSAFPSGNVQFNPTARADTGSFLEALFGKTQKLIETQLSYATGGYYGAVEQNKFESLGVYFANIRGADPKFFNDEPMVIWGTLRAKSYHDPVIVSYGCYRTGKDNIKIGADRIIPEKRFPVFELDSIDTECTFLPHTGEDIELKPGTNVVTFSADYNFNTDAYIKTYFVDKDRQKANLREDVDILDQFGITDKNPIAIYTNGPVEIGMESGPLISVSPGYQIKPTIGVSLKNRNEIQDKDKKIISKWDGKIKKITELVILTPPGITIGSDEEFKNCYLPDDDAKRKDCPCNVPFKKYDVKDCTSTCTNIQEQCNAACSENYASESSGGKSCIDDCQTSFNKCGTECTFLFNPQGDNQADKTKGSYNGYALDTEYTKFKELKDTDGKYLNFRCRYDIDTANFFEPTPITTRYFRARARYNYTTENSVNVAVQESPFALPESTKEAPHPVTPPALTYTPSSTDLDKYLRSLNSPLEGTGQCFLDTEKDSGISYALMLAIAAGESGWGKSYLAQNSNNLFGIKCEQKYTAQDCTLTDKSKCCSGEYKKSALDMKYEPKAKNSYNQYRDWCESIHDFPKYLARNPGLYSEALQSRSDPIAMVRKLGTHYATDPDWADKVIKLMAQIQAGVRRYRTSQLTQPGIPVDSTTYSLQAPERTGVPVDRIILHHTGDDAASTTYSTLKSRGLSVNYIVDKDGKIYYLVDEKLSAQHAGEWNSMSIGIEIVNLGCKSTPFTEVQYNSIKNLINDIAKRWPSITIDNAHVYGHFEVPNSPGKYDPSPKFDWGAVGLQGHQTSSDIVSLPTHPYNNC